MRIITGYSTTIELQIDVSYSFVNQISIVFQSIIRFRYQYFNWPGSIRVPAPCQVSFMNVKRKAFKTLFYCFILFTVCSQVGLFDRRID